MKWVFVGFLHLYSSLFSGCFVIILQWDVVNVLNYGRQYDERAFISHVLTANKSVVSEREVSV